MMSSRGRRRSQLPQPHHHHIISPPLLLLLLVVCTSLLCLLDTSRAHSNDRVRDASLMFEYSFDAGQHDQTLTSAADSVGGPFSLGDLRFTSGRASWLTDRVGVQVKKNGATNGVAMNSTNSIAKMLANMISNSATSYHFDMWLDIDVTFTGSNVYDVLAGFADWKTDSYATAGPDCTDNTAPFSVVRVGTSASYLRHTTKSVTTGGNTVCETQADFQNVIANLASSTGNKGHKSLHHIATFLCVRSGPSDPDCPIAANDPGSSYTSRCVAIDSSTFCFGAPSSPVVLNDFSTWATNRFLQVLPVLAGRAETMNLYHLAFYNRSLTTAERLKNVNAGLANSVPYAQPGTVKVYEDNVALSKFTINTTDYDFEARTLQITRLPLLGKLYEVTSGGNVEITTSMLPHNLTTQNTSTLAMLASQPSSTQVASIVNFANFTFRAADAKRFGREAVISITLFNTNDAPTVANISLIAYEGVAALVTLTGTEVDPGDSVDQGVIQSLPSSGYINKTNDGTTIAASSSVTTTPTLLGTNKLKCFYTPQKGALTGVASIRTDKFKYTVRDTLGQESLPAFVLVDVRNSLEATDSSPLGVEDTNLNFTLTKTDRLGATGCAGGTYVYTIVSLPSATKGKLYQNDGTEVTTVPVIAQSKYMLFIPVQHGYDATSYATFTYRVNCTADNRMSGVGTQTLRLSPVNDPITATYPSATQLIKVEKPFAFTVTLNDVDAGSDIVRVRARMQSFPDFSSSITLNENAVGYSTLTFISNRINGFDWVEFEGTRTAVNAAMTQMTFTRSIIGDATVVFTVTDTNHGSTQNTDFSMKFTASEDFSNAGSEGLFSSWYITGIYAGVILIPCMCCCLWCVKKLRRLKEAKHQRRNSLPRCMNAFIMSIDDDKLRAKMAQAANEWAAEHPDDAYDTRIDGVEDEETGKQPAKVQLKSRAKDSTKKKKSVIKKKRRGYDSDDDDADDYEPGGSTAV